MKERNAMRNIQWNLQLDLLFCSVVYRNAFSDKINSLLKATTDMTGKKTGQE